MNPFVQPHSFHLPNYVFLHFSLPIMCIAAWRSGHWVTLTPFTELPALHQHELSLFFLILLHKIWPAYSFHLPLNTLGNCIIKEWQWNNKTSTNPNNLKNIWGAYQILYQNYLLHHFNRPSYSHVIGTQAFDWILLSVDTAFMEIVLISAKYHFA